MLAAKIARLTIVIMAVICCGAFGYFIIIDSENFVAGLTICVALGIALYAARFAKLQVPIPARALKRVSRVSAIADGLLAVGIVLALAAVNLLSLPTKEDRLAALAVPALLFGAGIVIKIYYYAKRLGNEKTEQ
jgi:hypothetical protein